MELDEKTRRRNTWIASFSQLSTSFNLVNINLAHVIMENQYCGGDYCSGSVSAASTACLVGAIVGQLTFGYVGDTIGRGTAMQLTMVLSVLGAFASAFVVPLSSDGFTVFALLSVTRFVMGIGVGGVYPLAATISAESSSESNRGRSVAIVFSMQGIGTLLVPVIGLFFLSVFGTPADRISYGAGLPGISWRCLLGVGAIPGLILAPIKARSASPVPPIAAASAAESGDVAGAGCAGGCRPAASKPEPAAPKITLLQALAARRYRSAIIGCAGGWFLFDVTFYGNTLFAPTILRQIFRVEEGSTIEVAGKDLQHNLCYQLAILALIGLPGYYVSVCLMDYLGRRVIQIQGFVMLAALYGVLAFWMDDLSNGMLLFVYGLTYFFSNFGPNSTTFILPAEMFPYEVRSTLNGFCAAMGKAGAALGSACFKLVVEYAGSGVCFGLCAGCALLGLLVTVLFVEDRRGMRMASNDDLCANLETSMQEPDS